MLSIFFIGVALSLDAFSLALCIGTTKVTNKQKLRLAILVGIMHFFMPLIGQYLGNTISNFFEFNIDAFIIIVFIYLGTNMIIEKDKSCNNNYYSFLKSLVFAFSVSVDSFSVGLFLNVLTEHYIWSSVIFSFCSSSITYLGLILGEYSTKLLKEKASIVGGILLYLLAIVNLYEHFF